MRQLTWTIYRRATGWRVRARARNGNVVFASSEGYTKRSMAVRNAMLFAAPAELTKHRTVRTWVQVYENGAVISRRKVLA